MKLYEEFLTAVIPLMKLLTLAIIGLVLSQTRIVPRATFKLLSKLVFALFLPCLIFYHVGRSVNLVNFIQWWFIPVNLIISTVIGGILGYIVAIVCQTPPQYIRLTIVMTAFTNTGSLPIAIVGSVCHSNDHQFGPDCKENGIAYVSFAQWLAMILVYTVVYHMMEPPLDYYEVVPEEGNDIEEHVCMVNYGSRPLLVEAEWPGIEDRETEQAKTPFIARIFNSLPSVSQANLPDFDSINRENTLSSSISCLAEPRVVRKIRIVAEKTPVQQILQPPTVAFLLAIIVGLVPQLKEFFFGYDAPLSFFTDSLYILAGAMVPSVMLILGGMLAEGPNDSKLGIKTTIGITVTKLFILPLFGIGLVALAGKMNMLVGGDNMFKFMLLLQYCSPSAILLGAIASLRGYAVSEASALLFWQHIFALFSITLYIFVYFKLLPLI